MSSRRQLNSKEWICIWPDNFWCLLPELGYYLEEDERSFDYRLVGINFEIVSDSDVADFISRGVI